MKNIIKLKGSEDGIEYFVSTKSIARFYESEDCDDTVVICSDGVYLFVKEKPSDILLKIDGDDLDLMRTDDVVSYLGVSRAKFYKDIKEGVAPSPIKKGRMSFWRKEDINNYIVKGFTHG